MKTKLFMTLPVADVPRSRAFWTELGYVLNPEMTGEDCACFVLSEEVMMMVATHAKFMTLSPKPICDATKFKEVLFCLSLDSRQQVDEMVAKAVAAGGTVFEKAEDHCFMYSHSFIDPDGHGWGLVCMTGPPPK